MGRRQLGHLPGPHEQRPQVAELAEDLARERDRRVADRYRALAEPGLGAHALAGAEGPVEQPVEEDAGVLLLRGDRERVLDLAEYLRLAHDERVEAGRHAEQMAGDVGVRAGVQVGRDLGLRHVVEPAHEGGEGRARALRIVADDVDLRPVARRQDDDLAQSGKLGQLGQRMRDAAPREVDPFAQIDRRAVMACAEQEQVHGAWSRLRFERRCRRAVSRSCGSASRSSLSARN